MKAGPSSHLHFGAGELADPLSARDLQAFPPPCVAGGKMVAKQAEGSWWYLGQDPFWTSALFLLCQHH